MKELPWHFEIDHNMTLSVIEGNIEALTVAFDWDDSSEGFDFWQDIYDAGFLSNEARLKLEGYMKL
jgi:hypothetical protein